MCSEYDVLLLQETWLFEHDFHIFNCINDFDSLSVSAMDASKELFKGRPHGGLTILWRRSLLGNVVSTRTFNDPRIIGVDIMLECHTVTFLNLYLPTMSAENSDLYMFYVGKLGDITNTCDLVICIGDFNAHPGSMYYDELLEMCEDNGLRCADVLALPTDSFTHVNNGHLTCSWLDHILCSETLVKSIKNIKILDSIPCSDHLPLTAKLIINNLPERISIGEECESIKWEFSNSEKISRYRSLIDQDIQQLQYDQKCSCYKNKCIESCHVSQINDVYNSITSIMLKAGKSAFGSNKRRWRPVPGWNEYVRELHVVAREAFISWRSNGSPRTGELAMTYRATRARYKAAIRAVKREDEIIRANKHAENLRLGESRSLWSDLRNSSGDSGKRNMPNKVEDAIGEEKILNLWKMHFSSLLNSVNCTKNRSVVESKLSLNKSWDMNPVSTDEIVTSMEKLSKGKACGPDKIPSEAWMYAPKNLLKALSRLFTMCLSHSYIPELIMAVDIMPLIKNRQKDASDIGNYRPIAIATSVSKILEHVVLNRLHSFLYTTDCQFGFKPNHSTDQCIYVLKETVNYYISKETPVFLCFMDIRKAYDRVNYWILLEKLYDRQAPGYLISVLAYWFSNQFFRVKWGNGRSEIFCNGNGLRQGGILSPQLFNVYLDSLSIDLQNERVGCYINGVFINCLMYADDMVLLAPTVNALQQLIRCCESFANDHDIIFNESKTECMAILPKNTKIAKVCNVCLNGKILKFVDHFRYLGHIISKDWSDDLDIMSQCRRLNVTGNLLTRKFSYVTYDVKIMLFKAYCYGVYCASLWSNYKLSTFNRIRVTYNNIFRRFFKYEYDCSASNMFVVNNVRGFTENMRFLLFSLITRIYNSPNILIRSILRSEVMCYSRLVMSWNQMLGSCFTFII
jgi:hypothetical protein